jgi:hypothetical protein
LAKGPNLNFDDLKSFGVMVNLNNAMSPYAAVVGIPPAEMREVKATWLGRIVQRREAPKMYMTVTAFRGCLLWSTWLIQDERGRTPSRATAKMRREAATIATLVLYARWCKPSSDEVTEGNSPRSNPTLR